MGLKTGNVAADFFFFWGGARSCLQLGELQEIHTEAPNGLAEFRYLKFWVELTEKFRKFWNFRINL